MIIASLCMMMREEYNEISHRIIGCAMNVHRNLGPGLLESAYQTCLAEELRSNCLNLQEQVPLPLVYNDSQLAKSYSIDILVENAIVLELKSVKEFQDVHYAQILTYLKLGDYKLGLLLNFNVHLMKQGIRRVVYNF